MEPRRQKYQHVLPAIVEDIYARTQYVEFKLITRMKSNQRVYDRRMWHY